MSGAGGVVDREVNAVIEALYQAALEPEMWNAALARMAALLRSDQALLTVNGAEDQGGPLVAAAGMSWADVARFCSPEAMELFEPHISSYLSAAALPPGKATVQEQVFTDDVYERTGFYNEIIRPTKMFYGTGIVQYSQDVSLNVTVCRARAEGHFTLDESRLFEQLFAHLKRAITLHRRLNVGGARAAGFSIIERLDIPTIVLDAACRPLIVNAGAQRILRSGDGLSFQLGELQAATPALTAQLRIALTRAATSPADHGQRLHLPRRGQRLPLLLDIVPAWRLGVAEPGLRAPRVVMFIKEPDMPPSIDRLALSDTFGLTRRECEIVCHLAEGMSVDAIAAHLGLRAGTVRQNLKSAYEKTRVHSQAALVALALGFGR